MRLIIVRISTKKKKKKKEKKRKAFSILSYVVIVSTLYCLLKSPSSLYLLQSKKDHQVVYVGLIW